MNIDNKDKNNLFNLIPNEFKNNSFYAKFYKSAFKLLNKIEKRLLLTDDIFFNFTLSDAYINSKRISKIYIDYSEEDLGNDYEYYISFDKVNNICKFWHYTFIDDFGCSISTLKLSYSKDKKNILVTDQKFEHIIADPKVIEIKSIFDKWGNELERKEINENLRTYEVYSKKEIHRVKEYKNLYLYCCYSEGKTEYIAFIKDDKDFDYILNPTNEYFDNNPYKEKITEKEFSNILNGYYTEEDICRLFDRESELVMKLSPRK